MIISQQSDQNDCGVICLQSLLKFYGGDASLEKLRLLSGTNDLGTSMLGLGLAAKNVGFKATGVEISVQQLIALDNPTILHLTVNNGQGHFVICYEAQPNKFTIADPALGKIEIWDLKTLTGLWKSKACLILRPKTINRVKNISLNRRQFFLNLLKPDIHNYIITIILGLIISAQGLLMAVFSQHLIDDILPKQQTEKLTIGIILISAVLLTRILLQRARQSFLARLARDFNVRLNQKFYQTLISLPLTYFESRKIGELIARMNDGRRIQGVIIKIGGESVIQSLTILSALVVIISYNWQIGMITLAWSMVTLTAVQLHRRNIKKGNQKLMESYAQSESFNINSLKSISLIKHFNQADFFSQKQHELFNNFQTNSLDLNLLNIKVNLLVGVSNIILSSFTLSFLGFQVIAGETSIGEMIAILSLLGVIVPLIANIAMLAIPVYEAKVAFNRMYEFVLANPENLGGMKADRIDSLKLDKITFKYPGRKTLIANISLACTKGDIVLIEGTNGSGKTTILKLIQKIYSPNSGDIIVNNISLNDLSLECLREKCSFLEQSIPIINGSLIDNLLVAKANLDSDEMRKFLTQEGFDNFFRNFPQGYESILGENGIKISGGQKQLIGLARALLRRPQVLLLDEPESYLDMDSKKFLFQKIQALRPEAIIIIASHNLQSYERLTGENTIRLNLDCQKQQT